MFRTMPAQNSAVVTMSEASTIWESSATHHSHRSLIRPISRKQTPPSTAIVQSECPRQSTSTR